MDTFRWIAIVVATILGLGVARLLNSAVTLFRARHRPGLDWLPMVWAAMIFGQQMDFWWALQGFTAVTVWSIGGFLLLVGLVLTLFVAAALILPAELAEGESLETYFEQDGRWALIVLACFNGLAIIPNVLLGDEGIFSLTEEVNMILAAVPVVAFAGSRPVRIAATAVYVPVIVAAIIRFSAIPR